MRLGLAVLTPLFLSTACAASQTKSDSPSQENLTPGQECLAAAGAARDPGEDAPTSIGVSHILVRHAELARPEGATRSKEDACLRALEALETLNASGDWNQVVQDFSESGKSTNGDLGTVKRDEVTGPFGDAAFALAVDELSYVVETDRGFHIILRTE